MTSALQSTYEAYPSKWPALRNHIPCMTHVMQLGVNHYICQKVMEKQKQRVKLTTTTAIFTTTEFIDSECPIGPGPNFPAPARLLEEGTHRNPHY
jgi:hypothetical protein